MKILLITWACDADDVSEPRVAYNWVREIAKRHDVTLFSVSIPHRYGCVRRQFPNFPVIEWRDIRVPKQLQRFRAMAKPGYFYYFGKARNYLKFHLKQNKYDVIHHLNPFSWRYASPAYGLGVPLIRGPLGGGLPTPTPFVQETDRLVSPYVLMRKLELLRVKYDRTLSKSYSKTDCCLVTSPYVLELMENLRVNRFEIEIEHGCDSDALWPVPQDIQKPTGQKLNLLFVGRIIRTKGVRDAIRALALMKMKDKVTFTIIGDGDDLNNCKKEIAELRLQRSVECKGWCNQDQVVSAYANADVFLFPSFREPSGGVLIEAMSHGLPSIVCDYGGPANIIDNNSGFKIPLSTPSKFAQKIAEKLDMLVEDPHLRKTLGRGAFENAIRNFDWDRKLERLNNIYVSLTG